MDNLMPLLLTVVPIAWGLIVKYHPKWEKVPNAIIPYATMLVALLTKLVAPEAAHAADFAILGVAHVPIVMPGWLSWSIPVLSAGWQAIQNSLIYEVFLRSPMKAVAPTPR